MILRQIPCLKTLKTEIERYTDGNRPLTVILSGRFFSSFYDCPKDLSKKVVD